MEEAGATKPIIIETLDATDVAAEEKLRAAVREGRRLRLAKVETTDPEALARGMAFAAAAPRIVAEELAKEAFRRGAIGSTFDTRGFAVDADGDAAASNKRFWPDPEVAKTTAPAGGMLASPPRLNRAQRRALKREEN